MGWTTMNQQQIETIVQGLVARFASEDVYVVGLLLAFGLGALAASLWLLG